MTKVYISNIKSDIHKDDGRPLIAELGIHELICDRRIETSNKVKKMLFQYLMPSNTQASLNMAITLWMM